MCGEKMSYIVEEYITIANNIIQTQPFDSDEHINLMKIADAIVYLDSINKFVIYESTIINEIFLGSSFSEISRKYKISRYVIRTIFKNGCEKIANYLGGYFTTEGFIEYMREEYKLDDAKIRQLVELTNGRFMHRLKRRNNA
jgi:hypothetical protein